MAGTCLTLPPEAGFWHLGVVFNLAPLTKQRSQLVSKNFDPEAEKGLLEHVVVEIRVQVKIDRTN